MCIRDSGYTDQCAFALDCASSEMYEAGKGYYLNGRHLTSGELIAYAKGLTEKYHFVFIEDLLDENDWEGYEKAHREITRTSVSYTHLDVYKRQALSCGQSGPLTKETLPRLFILERRPAP